IGDSPLRSGKPTPTACARSRTAIPTETKSDWAALHSNRLGARAAEGTGDIFTTRSLRPAYTCRWGLDGQHLTCLCLIGGPLHAVPFPCHQKQCLPIFATKHTCEAPSV